MMTEAGRLLLDELRQGDLDPAQLELPWGGRSPRVLTQAHIRFSLRPRDDEDEPSASDAMVEEMCRRHQYGY